MFQSLLFHQACSRLVTSIKILPISLILSAFILSLYLGLCKGFLSLSLLDLQLKLRTGTDLEKKQAKVLIPILERHHLLLVSLTLCFSSAYEILPIFLDKLIGPVGAVVISTSVVLFIGGNVDQMLDRSFVKYNKHHL